MVRSVREATRSRLGRGVGALVDRVVSLADTAVADYLMFLMTDDRED